MNSTNKNKDKETTPGYGYGAVDAPLFAVYASKPLPQVEPLGFRASFETGIPPSVAKLVGRLTVAAQGAVAYASRYAYAGRHHAEPAGYATYTLAERSNYVPFDELFYPVEIGAPVTKTVAPQNVMPGYFPWNGDTVPMRLLPSHDHERQEAPLEIAA